MDWTLLLGLGFLAFVIYMSFSKRGRGRMLGGKIKWSGQYHLIDKQKFAGSESRLQVHAIEGKAGEEDKVGLELRHKSYMGFSVQPISLTVEQAKWVAQEIQEAIKNTRT